MWPPSWWKSFSLDLLGSACFLTCVHWHFSHNTPLTRTWLSFPCTLPVGSCIKQWDLPLFFSSSSLRLSRDWSSRAPGPLPTLTAIHWNRGTPTSFSFWTTVCAGEPVTEHNIPHKVSKGPKRGGNHIPQPVGFTLTNTAQHMIGLLCGKGKLLTCSTCCPFGTLASFSVNLSFSPLAPSLYCCTEWSHCRCRA